MKKIYVRPESRLLVINLTENIASSSAEIISGGHIIMNPDGMGGYYYSTYPNAKVALDVDAHWVWHAAMIEEYHSAGMSGIVDNCTK